MDNAEATPPVAGKSVTTTRGASGLDWTNLQQDYERLGSFKAVAAEYGVAPETVSRKAKELGVRSRRRWRGENLDPAELRRLYERGMNAAELAERFNSSPSAIYARLWAAGTEMRSSGPRDFTWGPEQYEKRRLATERGAYKGLLRERTQRPGYHRPLVNSPQEKLFQQALVKARLSFETQARVLMRFWPDIKLHQQPILIEIDGWAHGMPDNRAFDQQRDALLTAAGYTVIRFTNEQVEAGPDGCVRQMVERFGLSAEENPVAVIRDAREKKPASSTDQMET